MKEILVEISFQFNFSGLLVTYMQILHHYTGSIRSKGSCNIALFQQSKGRNRSGKTLRAMEEKKSCPVLPKTCHIACNIAGEENLICSDSQTADSSHTQYIYLVPTYIHSNANASICQSYEARRRQAHIFRTESTAGNEV